MKKSGFVLICICSITVAVPQTNFATAATVIAPEGDAVVIEDDYFVQYYGNACDFDTDGDTERIAGFGKGLSGVAVKDGTLSFLTGDKENYFFMGRWFHPKGDVNIPDENIGTDWRNYASPVIKMRMRQSLPSSTWTVGYRTPRGKEGNIPAQTKTEHHMVEGSQWQELTFPVRAHTQRPIRALYFGTDEPDNAIEIDYIKVVRPMTTVYYRTKVTLSNEPVHAHIRPSTPTERTVYVNGKPIHYFHGFYFPEATPVVDIAPYLHKGENTIAVGLSNAWHRGENKFRLCCPGFALTRDGQFVRPSSDTNWLASFSVPENAKWMAPEYDVSDWAKAVPGGKTATAMHIKGPQTFYMGPLQACSNNEPIFNMDKGINISLPLPAGYTVQYTLTDSFSGEPAAQGVFDKQAEGTALEEHTLRYKPDHPGVWTLAMNMTTGEGEVEASRIMEIPVVGPIEQKIVKGQSFTEGMDLRPITEIDCTGEPSNPKTKLYYVRKDKDSTIVNVDFGSYRESQGNAYSGFGYTFPVENLYRPHVVEVEYPDDKERIMMVKIFSKGEKYTNNPERTSWNWLADQRWYAGTATGGEDFPVSRSFKTMHLLFWPNGHEDVNTIQIFSEKAGLKAAARRIRVYEVMNDIPALEVPRSDHRLYGQFAERERILVDSMYPGKYSKDFATYGKCYHDKIGRIRDWYATTETLIKYMRFAGQNVYVPGYCMYNGIFFPEDRGQGRGGSRRLQTDHFRLMAAMFEANGLNLIIGTQYETALPPLEEAFPTNGEVLNHGKESVLGVCVNGIQAIKSGSAGAGALDYQHPAADEDLRAMLEIFLKYGQEYSSVKGILFHTAFLGFPSIPMIHIGGITDSSLAWNLTDGHVRKFTEQTGVQMPGDPNDRERMLKRYEFLKANQGAREKWADFQSRRLHDQVADLLDLVHETRPDWKFFVNAATRPSPHEQELVDKGELSYEEGTRLRGYDMSLYKEEAVVNNRALLADRLRESGDLTRELEGYEKDALCYETRWPVPAHTQAVVPVEPYSARDMVLNLLNYTPEQMIFGKADMRIITGGEQRLRPFVRAFRSIPQGNYKTLRGDGLDKNMVVRFADTEQGPVFYVVNPHKYPFHAALSFSNPVDVKDLVSGENAVEKSKQIAWAMKPFDLRVFASSAAPIAAKTKIPKDVMKLVEERLSLLSYCEELGNETIAFLLKQWLIDASAKAVLKQIADLKQLHEDGDILRVIDIYGRTEFKQFLERADAHRSQPKASEAHETYRVNCGSSESYEDSRKNMWLPDQQYVYGANSYGFLGNDKSVKRKGIEIRNTEDHPIYSTERFDVQGYRFTVPNGRYTLALHFAEVFKPRENMRVFDVNSEGKTILNDFDPFAKGGFQTAITETIKGIEVNDGELTVDFSWSTEVPVEINGIEAWRE